jgi:hypothetical protein
LIKTGENTDGGGEVGRGDQGDGARVRFFSVIIGREGKRVQECPASWQRREGVRRFLEEDNVDGGGCGGVKDGVKEGRPDGRTAVDVVGDDREGVAHLRARSAR